MYSHQWYLDNGYDDEFDYEESVYNVGDRTKIGTVENVTFILSYCNTWRNYFYFINGKQYGEKQLIKLEQAQTSTPTPAPLYSPPAPTPQYSEESKRYVWNLLKQMNDSDTFEVADSLIPASDFIAICKVIMDGRHLWPDDVSFNEAYTKIKKISAILKTKIQTP